MKFDIENMLTPNGNRAKNQFKIYTEEGVFFKSYSSIIVLKKYNGEILLDKDYWNYSPTTAKYRRMFLNEYIDETRLKIKSGVYKLVNLN